MISGVANGYTGPAHVSWTSAALWGRSTWIGRRGSCSRSGQRVSKPGPRQAAQVASSDTIAMPCLAVWPPFLLPKR